MQFFRVVFRFLINYQNAEKKIQKKMSAHFYEKRETYEKLMKKSKRIKAKYLSSVFS